MIPYASDILDDHGWRFKLLSLLFFFLFTYLWALWK